ncbi:MAG TPA: ion channel [Rhizomicrobium sp.]|nr:ion channel [Rhizomicrobium sp.]
MRGQDRSRFTDFYHAVLTASWGLFILEVAAAFAIINALFAVLYSWDAAQIAHARPGNFWDMYVFSVQILGGVSFSDMAPKSVYADVVAVAEALVGILFLGIIAAVMFARLSRPTARVVFSKVAVIVPFEGVPTLMFRAANQRGNQVFDAAATVSVAMEVVTTEGIQLFRLHELELARSRSPLFALSWTIMHPITEKSPLYGLDAAAMGARDLEILILLSGRDETLADTIYARHSYTPEHIVWGHRFVDVFAEEPDGRFSIDLRRFHDTEQLEIKVQ